MSNTFETCNICGSNDCIQFCANCGTKCCKKCYELHDASVCSYIKDSKCHLCEIHGELSNPVTGYCFQCQHLVCELCQTIEVHDDHSIVGLTEAVFIVQSEQYTERDEKRSIDTTSDTKKLIETLTIQIENQCKKIVDCISEKKCKLLSELNEHKQYLEEYATEMERDIQSVREKMSEFKTSRAVFPLLFLHKWQTFAKQMNKLEKPADRLTFLCGLINIYNLDEQFGKLQNVHPQKGMIDEEVDKLASDDAFKVKDTDMVSSQYKKILTQNESLKREVVGLKSEQEMSKTEISYMIQLSEQTCQFVKDCNNKLEDSRFHVNETYMVKRLGNNHMDWTHMLIE
ncbi:TRIM46 [Mytilus edulis]|uniref:TRIM46 n=1 Tax=Mytilus edulis TaxID=6550 RepID=A0A8S3TVM0_MYTED|nr:TRIM46 [Mytilus edulis]